MPTENRRPDIRSVVTESLSNEFKREDRYIVIKRSDTEKAPADLRRSFSGQCRKLHEAMLTHGAPARSFVVVESDWPEYGFVWLMLEHRMAGYPVPDFNAVKCAADVAAAQFQLTALSKEVELLKTQAINDTEANTAIRAERDALQLRLNEADQRIDELTIQQQSEPLAFPGYPPVPADRRNPFTEQFLEDHLGKMPAPTEPPNAYDGFDNGTE